MFYYDHKTGESVWSHPLLQTFRNLHLNRQVQTLSGGRGPAIGGPGRSLRVTRVLRITLRDPPVLCCSRQEEPYLHPYYRDLFNNLRQYSDQTKGWWALNLLASPNSGPPPAPEEVADMASYLGIDSRKEYYLMWCAKQAVQVLSCRISNYLRSRAALSSQNAHATALFSSHRR